MAQLTALESIRTVGDASDLRRMRTNDVFFSQCSPSEDVVGDSPPRLEADSFSSPEQTSVTITIGSSWHPPTQAGRGDGFLHPTQHASTAVPEDSLPQFNSRTFRREDADDTISEFLEAQGQGAKGLIVIIVEGWNFWIAEPFERTIPGFPTGTFARVKDEHSVLPNLSTQNSFYCVTEHVETWARDPSSPHRRRVELGANEARRLPIAVWSRLRGASKVAVPGGEREYSPTIILCCEPGTSVPQRIKHFYRSKSGNAAQGSHDRRWQRLESYAFWVYADLFTIFTNWDSTWEAATRNLSSSSQGLFDGRQRRQIMENTKSLHRDTAATIDLRGSMRLQKFSIKYLHDAIARLAPRPDTASASSRSALVDRLQNMLVRLDYYELASQTLLSQQQNLLSLALNTEAVSQTQAVNRITLLGFVFLPLAFVAV
ncbi:hypothetical protein C8A00DRAFT_37158 [Chaetomidium leptoderma]|uniref:Uncharacterized protein n=1 Tax=Chaetomidium leptoderma TaxID=669021 RepID=A0AAN6VFB8_9PEZI|nr:hypothetical protein C8A00DRAFT_37158 [Chaetomidium leptoderma]